MKQALSRAIMRADAQATAARNADFTQNAPALANAVADVQAAQSALKESLTQVKGIVEIFDKISQVLEAASAVLKAGVFD